MSMRTRVFAVAALAASASVLTFLLELPRPAAHNSRHSDVTLVYVGADDCPPCRAWQLEAGARFRASPEFAAVTYREVKSPHLLDLLKDEYWPEELRVYRDRLGRGAGAPLWLVISDNEIVAIGAGISQWQGAVVPRLRSLIR